MPKKRKEGSPKATALPSNITKTTTIPLKEEQKKECNDPKMPDLYKILSYIDSINISQQSINKKEIENAEIQVKNVQKLQNSEQHEERGKSYEEFSACIVSLFNIHKKNADIIQTLDEITKIISYLDYHIEILSQSLHEESANDSSTPNHKKTPAEENQILLAKKEQLGHLKQVVRKLAAESDSIDRLNELRSTLIFIYRYNVDNILNIGNESNHIDSWKLAQAVENLDPNIQAWFKEGWTTQKAALEAPIKPISDAENKSHTPRHSLEKARFFEDEPVDPFNIEMAGPVTRPCNP
jgi:hypothetical protein